MADKNAYTGEIRLFGFSFTPLNWARCDGQLLDISNNQELFSLLGTQFGGDGRRTFGLPDLRGRVAVHQGSGPGLGRYEMGQKSGMEMVQLTEREMPSHTHAPQSSDQPGNKQTPSGGVSADENHSGFALYGTTPDGVMQETTSAGGNMAHNNMQPYTVANYCICLKGIYPNRQ
ncbi:phage tail protein [Shimia haliotis]|uniref:Microcystin-dependent protein n=1 Tax=Shimia haliotis TaxID=1280847 RepID=A0A1I4CRP6_9RHOB|nr:tail fiber protein [Shimia haliotis]SFK82611.1 Microcystin-dependent protein [Shimia haliotis]